MNGFTPQRSHLKKVLFIFVSVLVICGAIYYSTKKTEHVQIIYLNGASSAGKSTLARALQQKLQKPFLVLGIDQLIFMMPEKLNAFQGGTSAPGFSWQPIKQEPGEPLRSKIVVGPFGERIIQALKAVAITLARSGFNLIIDDVAFGKEAVDAWRVALKHFDVLWVGVSAPIEVIEARERARGDRKLGQARWQAELVHTNVTYDLMVDTHAKTVEEIVATICGLIE